MKKIILMLFIFCGSLFAEDSFEVTDSTKIINTHGIKSELLDKIDETNNLLNGKIDSLQEVLNKVTKTISKQQENLNDLETKILSTMQRITNLTDNQRKEINALDEKNNEQSANFTKLKNDLETNLTALNDSLGITSNKLSISSVETKKKLGNIDKSIESKTLYIIIGSLVLLLFIVIVFFVLKISIKNKTKNLDDNIMETRNKMDIEIIKLDAKLVEILEKQVQVTELKSSVKNEEIDHSIFIKVANEIQRMRRRISNMPDDTKGIGALKNALRRLEEGLNDNEYELIDLTGQEYKEGINAKPRFVESEDLQKGQQIITKTIKLQINYKEKIIQPAEIEVSIGE
jgi:hypothetical protein